jgi:hypothetical protein
MSLFQNVRELFRRPEKPCGAVRFWRHAGLLAMRLRHQQRTALDSDGESRGAAEGEAFRWQLGRRRAGGKSSQIRFATSVSVESPQAEQDCDPGFRANSTLAANVSFNFLISRCPFGQIILALTCASLRLAPCNLQILSRLKDPKRAKGHPCGFYRPYGMADIQLK